jgi:hypothetical protein
LDSEIYLGYLRGKTHGLPFIGDLLTNKGIDSDIPVSALVMAVLSQNAFLQKA